jgi:hypothetical protein
MASRKPKPSRAPETKAPSGPANSANRKPVPREEGISVVGKNKNGGGDVDRDSTEIPEHYSPSEILKAYSNLRRVRLHFWMRDEETPVKGADATGDRRYPGRKPGPAMRMFTEDQLPQLAILNRAYAQDLTASATREALKRPQHLLREEYGIEFVGPSISAAVIRGDEKGYWGELAALAHRSLACERVRVLEVTTNPADGRPAYRQTHVTPSFADADSRQAELYYSLLLSTSTDVSNRFGASFLAEAKRSWTSRTLCSVLAAPIKVGCAATTIFWLIAENKKDSQDHPNPATIFDPVDCSRIRNFALSAASMWPVVMLNSAKQNPGVIETEPLVVPLGRLLKIAGRAMGAARGHLLFWNPDLRRPEVKDSFGHFDIKVTAADLSKPKGICRYVLENEKEYYAETLPDWYYLKASTATESEYCVPVGAAPFRPNLAALNFESDIEHGFSELDRTVARSFASLASQLAKLATARSSLLQGILGGEHGAADLSNALKREFGFTQARVFLPDYVEAQLKLRNPDPGKEIPPLSFAKTSFATSVFLGETNLYSPVPQEDQRVHQHTLRALDVKGPILGVPLRFSKTTIGAVVCSGRPLVKSDDLDGKKPEPLEESKVPQLSQALEEFVSAYVSGQFAHRSMLASSALRELRLILRGRMLSTNCFLDAILKAILGIGFDRARAFVATDKSKPVLRCFASEGLEAKNALRGVIIDKCFQINFYEADGRKIRSARMFDPTDPRIPFDPHTKSLGKTDVLPYSNVPIWHEDVLLGALAADNRNSKARITFGLLESLEEIAENIGAEFAKREKELTKIAAVKAPA